MSSSNDDTPEPEHAADHSEMESLGEARMSIMEHLAALRLRLMYSVICVVLGFLIAWYFRNTLFTFLVAPLELAAPQEDFAKIYHKDVAEPFFVFLKISLLSGVFISSPGILYNVWRFVAPALYERERKLVIPFVAAATFFFFAGGAFCYFVVLPYGYNFLLDFSAGISDPQLMMDEYFDTTSKLLLGFGLVFEMPVFSMFLSATGIITHRTLLRHWRISLLAAFLMAALFTPPDVFTQMLMAGPLLMLYGISVAIAWFFSRDDGGDDGVDEDEEA